MKRRFKFPAAGILRGYLAVLWLAIAATASAKPIDIGSRLELFVDDLLIERMEDVELELHEPVRQPLAKSPLPQRHMVTVIRDDDLYRAYWRSSDPGYTGEIYTGHPGNVVCYAESRDGHEWEFPKLGLHEIEGSRDNNVILAKLPPLLENFTPFVDTRPGVDANERYKALAGYPGVGDKRGQELPGKGLHAFVSADGIHWDQRGEVIPYRSSWRHAFDSQNVSFWSDAEQQYVCYFRTWTDPERLRSISRTTSPDFVSWSEPVEMNPNLPGEHLYTNQTHPYFRAPHIYISLPTRFVTGIGTAPAHDTKDVNTTDILFMTTRAGTTKYDRPFRQAFIRPGLDPARWGNRANYAALNVVPTGPNEMSIYHRSGHRYALRTDGFVSVRAGADEGELLTKPVIFDGESLVLNISTSAGGGVRVELQEPGGKPISGFALADCKPVIGDEVERAVEWTDGQSVAALAGKPVRIRFVMKESDLYSLRFR